MATRLSPIEFGRKLRGLRVAAGYGEAKTFAARIGKTPEQLSRWENGKAYPALDALDKLARVLGTTVAELTEGVPGVSFEADVTEQPYDNAREERDLVAAAKIADPVLRILERESIAAVIRAQAVREAALAWRLAEQNAVTRTDAVREITSGRRDAGERITDADVDEVLTRRQQPEKSRASGE